MKNLFRYIFPTKKDKDECYFVLWREKTMIGYVLKGVHFNIKDAQQHQQIVQSKENSETKIIQILVRDLFYD